MKKHEVICGCGRVLWSSAAAPPADLWETCVGCHGDAQKAKDVATMERVLNSYDFEPWWTGEEASP